jgi:predicted ArsR family transcriptional regulator
MKHMTEHEARTVIAVFTQPGTSGDITKRSGVNDRTTRKNLSKLMADGVVERVHTWPMTYKFSGTMADVVQCQQVLISVAALRGSA